jgi:DNA-binding transcriptional regulator YiaG
VNASHPEREQVLMEKIRNLPPEQLGEVEDFVDFVRMRHLREVTALSEPVFASIWDNSEDAEYDRL